MARTNQTFKAALKLNAEQFKKEAANVKRTLGTLKSSFMGFAGALGAGLGFTQLIGTMRKTALELSTARATLENVSKETKIYSDGVHTAAVETSNYAENLKFVSGLAKKYKQDIITLTDSFAKFSAAASTANVNMATQRDVFESLTRAATFFHMSGDRTQQMMVAIEQMFSKGKVTSEELRRQLGNNLPGAFGLMAEAMGVSNAELDKMMKNGEVLAAVALPKFAKELNKVTKALNTDSLQLAQNELRNAWIKLVDSSGFENAYKKILQLTTRFLEQLKTNFYGMTGIIGGVLAGPAISKYFKKGLVEWDKYVKSVQGNINKLEKDFGKASGEFKQKYGLDPVTNRSQIRYAGKQKGATEMYNDYLKVVDVQKKIHAEQQKINGATSIFTKSVKGLARAFQSLGTVIKSALATTVFSAVLAIIGNIVGSVVDLVKRINEAKHAMDEVTKDWDKLSNNSVRNPVQIEVEGWVKSLQKLSDEGLQGTKEWKQYIGEINKLMGNIGDGALTVADNMDTIREKVGDWLNLLRKVEQYKYITNVIEESESKMFDLEQERTKILNGRWKPIVTKQQLKGVDADIEATTKKLAWAKDKLEEYQLSAQELAKINGDTGGDTGGGGKDKDPFKDTVEKQKQALKELENQFKAGAYTEEEYKKELDKIIVSTFEAITAFDDFKKALNDIGEGEWFDEIAGKFREIKQAALDAAAAEAEAERIAKMKDDMDKTLTNVKDYYSSIRGKDGVRGKRDTTFDYKKSESDKISGELDIINTQIEELEDNIKAANTAIENGWIVASTDLKRYTDLLKQAQKDAEDLNDKLVIAQLQEDISTYEKQMFDGMASGIKSTATAMDRLVTSTKNLFETMNNPDATAWEQIMSVFNEIVQVFDTITGLVDMFNKLSEVSNMLAGAKEVLANKELSNKEKQIAVTNALGTAEVTEATMAATAQATKAGAAQVAASAEAGEAIAAGTANAQEVPFPYNLVALAANIAAIIGALSAMNKYANGGIVGGNSTLGDNNVVRANSGEMILTKGQQGTLFSMLNGKGGLGGKVDFEIRGDRLWGTLQNYNNKIRG